MKAEDMVMVIENRKGHETNSLLTFDDFIKQHIAVSYTHLTLPTKASV